MSEDRIMQAGNKYIKIVISFLLSVININLAVSLEMWTKTAGKAAILLFGALGTVVGHILISRFLGQQEKRLRVHALLWGVLMAAAYVLGCLMRRDGTALARVRDLPGLIAQIACLAILAASCIAPFFKGFPKLRGKLYEKGGEAGRYREWQVWLISSAVILLCWMPVFLAYYPSVFAYDAEGQLYQVIAHDYSTHHPLLHTLFLGAFFQLGGKVFGSYQTGMAVHSVVQMIMMAGTFGYTIAYLYRKGISVYLRILLLFFYALFPVNSILAISTTKDVLFSAVVLLWTIDMYRITVERKKKWAAYVLWTVLMLLLRNNAVYAFMVTVPCVCMGIGRMKGGDPGLWKKYLACSMAALLIFMAGGKVLKAVTGAESGSPREMLSIPLQQMARTRVKEEQTLPPEMRQDLDRYLSSEWVFAAYNPYLADPVKNRAVIHDDPVGLIKTWIKLGVEHPQTYIDAFLDNSIGYWFIEDRTHAQIYGIGTESGFGYLSTDNREMPAGCEITEHSYLPGLRAVMEKIVSDNAYQKLPFLRIIFAPAFYWWMLCMYIGAVIYRKRYRLLLPVIFLAVYYMTLLLSPTVLIRYMYPFVVAVPAICCCLSKDLGNIDRKSIQ